ncbi:MAG: type II secretion system protein GspN [Desulfobacterales bacterium]|nr:type II secretion system protein GspN [Desulfobacterales bacterium]
MKKYKRLLGYILFAAILTAVLLYWRFPSEAVRQYLQAAAGRFDPHLAVTVHDVRPVLPFGLEISKAELGLKERPGLSLFKADSFVVMPSLRVLVLGRPAFRFDCKAYGGEIQGVISFKKYSLEGPFDTEIQVNSVRLGRHLSLKELFKREMTGEINATVNYTCSKGNFLLGGGSGDISVSNGSIRFAQPFLNMESFDFERLDAKIVLEEQRISLDSFDFKGKQMEGKVSGTIHLSPNFESFARSNLNLTVAAKAFPSLFKEMGGLLDVTRFLGQGSKDGSFTITIRGTVAQPRISFG